MKSKFMQKVPGLTSALLALAFSLPQIHAQQTTIETGTIAGKVTDQSGAMVSSVSIQLKNTLTGESQQVFPYIAGLYRFTNVKPGTYELHLHAEGFSDASVPKVEVRGGTVSRADVALQLSNLNGEVTINAEESKKSHTSSLLGDVPKVVAATLREQTLEEAPANVTVITASEIRTYGFRTLGEALSSARGFYFTNDGVYQYGGVRGLNIPGDYNSRFLVMINGHPMTENIYNSNGFFGQDFGLDMDLVERIEIVRGPSTTLYGSNGILANINIVTKQATDQAKLKVSTEYDNFNEKKIHFSSATRLWKGATLLVSGSVFNGGGRDLYVPAYNSPETNSGIAKNGEWERGYHSFVDLNWNDWRFTGLFSSREIAPPVSWGNAVFNTQGNRVKDGRSFAEASYTHDFASGSTLRWRLAYDNYRYHDQFYFASDDSSNPASDIGSADALRTVNNGDWLDTRLSYTFAVKKVGELTIGASTQFDLRAVQYFYDAHTNAQLVYVSHPDRTEGVFAQQEIKINDQLKAYIGVRYDVSRNFPNFFSPQASLVYSPTNRTILKGVYGRPFRNPSAYEQYYGDGYTQIPSGGLRQETAQVFEGSVERKLTPKWSVIANYYHYQIQHLIETIGVGSGSQYVNSANAQSTQGVEFEVSGRPRPWIQLVGSYGYGAARESGLWLQNSPRHLGKARAAFPMFKDKARFAAATQYIGSSLTATGTSVRQAMLVDFTMNTNRLNSRFDISAGVRNALGWRYDDPVALVIPQLAQPRQSFFVKLVYHSDSN